MNAPVYSAHKAKNILLISDTEDALRTEMQTLTALGALRFEHCSSVKGVLDVLGGLSALDGLDGANARGGRRQSGVVPGFDVILCDETLEGKSIYVLLRQFSADKDMARLPVLMVASMPQIATMASDAGLVALCRPYSQASFDEALSRAMSAMRKPLSPRAMEAACAKLTAQKRLRLSQNSAVHASACSARTSSGNPPSGKHAPERSSLGGPSSRKNLSAGMVPTKADLVRTTSDIMQEGLAHLRAGDLDKADAAFTSLVRRSYDNAEAYLGLARVRGRQEHHQEAVECLVRAAAAFKRQKKLEKSRTVYHMLPDAMQTGHIFLQEAGLCLRRGEYREAALSILEHLYEHPDARLHLVVGRLCQLTDAPDDSLKKLCETYTQLGYTSIAQRLHTQLMAEPTPVTYRRFGWLDHYPRLREAIEVASYTTALWRQA